MQGIFRSFAEDITQHRKHSYSHQILQAFLMAHHNVGCSTFKVLNNRAQQLQTMLLKGHKNNKCIIYAHGLGSNKLEVLPIAKFFIKQGFDICAFDFSGSGRSEGEITSYGLLQQKDLQSIISYLDKYQSYENYVLWGRSMGAVSIILNQGQKSHPKINCILLDSAFCSFKKVAIQIASKNSIIPEFMFSLFIQPLKTYCEQTHVINPFETDITNKIEKINKKIIVVYSKQDSLVSCAHSQQLIKHCAIPPYKVQIKENHNIQRSKDTLRRLLELVNQCLKPKRDMSKMRGISVASKQKEKDDYSIRSQSKIKLIINKRPSSSSLMSNTPARALMSIKNHQNMSKIELGSNCSQLSSNFSHNVIKTQPGNSPTKGRRKIGLTPMYTQNIIALKTQHLKITNKQNYKPSINQLRQNRFR